MSHYQQSDSLSLATDVPMSGTGNAAAESAAGNANYAAWPWEAVLATVLSIPVPDRGEITAQPWLTVQQNGQGDPGSHLIWTAGWDSRPGSGAASIQVYLNPALYTTGGAWDGFLNAPAAAMSGVTSASYGSLPLNPQSFQSASLAVSSLTNAVGTMAQQFGSLYNDVSSGTAVKGNVADVAGELLSSLQTLMLSMHNQMTNPTSYGQAIGAAGDTATAFLAALSSAYSGWTQVPQHSPLGAVVQVLTQIAGPDDNGSYVISDPQNTPYGDLTTAGAWGSVEQQAKNLWLSVLTGDSGNFGGLDPLSRNALAKLVDQYTSATGALVPVVGPAQPPIRPQAVDTGQKGPGAGGPGAGGPGAGGPGAGGPGAGGPGAGGPGAGGPGPGGNVALVIPPGGAPAATGGLGGAPGAGAPGPGGNVALVIPPGGAPAATGGLGGFGGAGGGGLAAGGQAAAGSAAVTAPGPVPASASLLAQPGGTAAGPGGLSTTPAPQAGMGLPAVGLMANASGGMQSGGPSATADVADPPGLPGGLSGAIGATADQNGQTSGPAAAVDESPALTGTIGKPNPASSRNGGPAAVSRAGNVPAGSGHVASRRRLPAAGFSLGRDPGGSVLKQAAVPVMADKPPSVTSSSVNAQLVPVGGGQTGSALPGGGPISGGPTIGGGLGAGESMPGVIGSAGGALGPGAGGMGANENPMMMMPPYGMGGGGRAGAQERERRAYLPEDGEYWGTTPGLPEPSVSAAADESREPDFGFGAAAVAGIGAGDALGTGANTTPDRRMP